MSLEEEFTRKYQMEAIQYMLKKSYIEGLEVEVVLEFVDMVKSGEVDFKKAAKEALYEWDIL
jgi:hypothetical protein